MRTTKCFGPPHLPGVPLHFEVLVALGTTKAENLSIISNKNNSMTRVNGAPTKPTLIQPHFFKTNNNNKKIRRGEGGQRVGGGEEGKRRGRRRTNERNE